MRSIEVHLKGSDKTLLVNPAAVASIAVIEPRPTPEDAEPKPYVVIELMSGTRYEITDDKAIFG